MESADTADVVVVGSGAAGLTAALAAAAGGKSTVVLEVDSLLGGTTALSGGGMWMPGNRRELEAGIDDSREGAEEYLRALADNRVDTKLLERYLDVAPEVVDFYLENSPLALYADQERPDYQSTLPGAQAYGRLLGAGTYDMHRLPDDIRDRIRMAPWPGGTEPILWTEMREFLERGDRWGWIPLAEERKAKGIVARGNALVAALVEACLDKNVEFELNTRASRLLVEGGRVTGVVALRDDKEVIYRAADGVILGSGGFESNPTLWRDNIGVPVDEPMSPGKNVGDGLRMATAVGARTALMEQVWWFVEGGAQPGEIVVNRSGRRFMNECLNYHDYGAVVTAFNRQTFQFENYPCFVISDVLPQRNQKWGQTDIETEVSKGTVARASTLAELAAEIGVDSAALEAEVAEFNEHAASGRDPKFHRGEAPFDHYRHYDKSLPNPALRPLGDGPYYAERVRVRCFGTKGGVVIDSNGSALGYDDNPIPGLFACGNVAASAFGVAYPGGGGTIGQAVVFGYLAGRAIGQDLVSTAKRGHQATVR